MLWHQRPVHHILGFAVVISTARACSRDNKAVAHCLHTYLERDFISIEAIVYPHKRREGADSTSSAVSRPGGGGGNFGERPILDGPEMQVNCDRIGWMVTCFEEVLVTCENQREFFRYRDLLRGVARVRDWVCEDVIHRFSVLVSSVSCYKRALAAASECSEEQLTENLWPQVLRMERDSQGICGPLRRQCRCLERSGQLEACEADAADLYHNVTGMFLDSYCGGVAVAGAVPPLVLAAALLGLLTAMWGF